MMNEANKLSVTGIIRDYHIFDSDFWLSYKTLQKLLPSDFFESIKLDLLRRKRFDLKSYPLDLQAFDIERELLKKEWEDKREASKKLGIETHEMIHKMFTSDFRSFNSLAGISEFKLGASTSDHFLDGGYGVFSELKLEVPLPYDYQLVGVADSIVVHPNNVVDVIDWKTSEDAIKFKAAYDLSRRKAKKMKYPLSAYDDSEGMHYQIQVSIYMWMILQLRPELRPGKLYIKWIKDGKVKKSYEVVYLKSAVDKLVKWHAKHLYLEAEFKKCEPIDYSI